MRMFSLSLQGSIERKTRGRQMVNRRLSDLENELSRVSFDSAEHNRRSSDSEGKQQRDTIVSVNRTLVIKPII
ncbi:hypothetical protein NECAME_14042 [Necator americanus]|uniref:Uncharacterized protein n=1 Tax=Necator americanus TaxID=51031 RepID=W2SQG5_NECAM|nr:hypothetical protein NECAME_14042 [Necator americanus]ETN71969.1 hypothetical protein NECAME_14042 [Necator americanus]